MQKIALISLFLVLSVNSFEYFLASPQQNFNLGQVQATSIAFASDQSLLLVGFQNGLIEGYNKQGIFQRNYTGHTKPIVAIEWIANIIFVSVDNTGLMIARYPNGTQIVSDTFPAQTTPIQDAIITFNPANGALVVGAIYASNVIQYQYNLANGNQIATKTYQPTGTQTFTITTAMYGGLYDFIAIGYKQSAIYTLNCSTGSTIQNFAFIQNIYPVEFLNYGNQYLVLDSSETFTQFNSTSISINSYTSQKAGTVATVCQSNLQVIFGYNTQAVLVAFEYGQTIGQQLSYLKSNAVALECGTDTLVSLDSSNFLAFNKYQLVNSKTIQGWVIAIIVISIILLVALIIGIVNCICRKRGQAQFNNSDYAKELNSSRR